MALMGWSRDSVIGRGSTATIYAATSIPSGNKFAVKSTCDDGSNCSMFLKKEHSFLAKLSSPYIIKCLGFDVTIENYKPVYNIFMEYAPFGSLFDAIQKSGGKLDEFQIKDYTKQILLGLDYLHSNGLVHCDIKSKNILLGEDHGVKIADLGCAKFVGNFDDSADCHATSVFSGTPAFMAPEVARGEEQGFEADVWALGCTMIEMATGNNPWSFLEISDPVTALYRIGCSEDVPDYSSLRLSVNAKDFVSKCLVREQNKRWTVRELLKHPFMDIDELTLKEQCSTNVSPNSVLDKGFWESFDQNPTDITFLEEGCSNFLNSPANRIKKLVLNSEEPNWDFDEDWVTIRSSSNSIEETIEISENFIEDDELQTSVDDFNEDFGLYNYNLVETVDDIDISVEETKFEMEIDLFYDNIDNFCLIHSLSCSLSSFPLLIYAAIFVPEHIF